MLSLRCVMPTMPMAAALSAAHLAAILFPPTLRRLYIVRDNDPAGDGAVATLIDRAQRRPGSRRSCCRRSCGDFNEDLRTLRHRCAAGGLAGAARPEDVARFMRAERPTGTGTGGAGRRRVRSDPGAFPVCRRGAAPRPSERAIGRQAARPGNGGGRLFSVAAALARGRFPSRSKIAGCRHPPLRFGRCRCARRCRSGPPAALRRHEGRDGRGRSDEGKPHDDDHDDTDYEPPHASSPTDHVLNELQLHGYRPFQDEPDPRPLPEARIVAAPSPTSSTPWSRP